jgi:hypothetical protein
MAGTCLLIWINWRILRISEDLLTVSKILLDETIKIRKQLTIRTKSTKMLNTPISGSKTR